MCYVLVSDLLDILIQIFFKCLIRKESFAPNIFFYRQNLGDKPYSSIAMRSEWRESLFLIFLEQIGLKLLELLVWETLFCFLNLLKIYGEPKIYESSYVPDLLILAPKELWKTDPESCDCLGFGPNVVPKIVPSLSGNYYSWIGWFITKMLAVYEKSFSSSSIVQNPFAFVLPLKLWRKYCESFLYFLIFVSSNRLLHSVSNI